MDLKRVSPAFDQHLAAGARTREKARWQRVDYYESNAEAGEASARPEGPAAESWSPAIEAEHRATRTRAGLFDLTSFGKVDVRGPEALDVLSALCSNDVGRPVGRLTYTQMLSESGGVVADVTVARLAEDHFLVVTGTSALEHDLALCLVAAQGRDVSVRDVTGAWCCFGVWGPLTREVLAPLVDVELDTASFGYMSTRPTYIGGVQVLLNRLTFVGELGWEVYAPTEYGRSLYSTLAGAVDAVGGLRCGYRAIDSLRVEKGYFYLGSDLPTDRTPIEAGLGRFVRKDRGFVGGGVLDGRGEPTERLACFTLDDSRFLLQGGEPVLVGGEPASTVTSAGFGHTLDVSVAFAYLGVDLLPGASLQVIAAGRLLRGTVRALPLYDPAGARILA